MACKHSVHPNTMKRACHLGLSAGRNARLRVSIWCRFHLQVLVPDAIQGSILFAFSSHLPHLPRFPRKGKVGKWEGQEGTFPISGGAI